MGDIRGRGGGRRAGVGHRRQRRDSSRRLRHDRQERLCQLRQRNDLAGHRLSPSREAVHGGLGIRRGHRRGIPATGAAGDTVTISGLSFGTPGADSYVSFAGIRAQTYLVWTDTQILVRAPEGITTGDVFVVTPQGSSNSLVFTIRTPTPASHTWYLAEGSTGSDGRGSFETWVLVQNPTGTSADVRITYMTDLGKMDGPRINVPPGSRHSVNVADTVPGTWSVSTEVSSDQAVIAERSVYWNAAGCYRQAATGSIGVRSPAKTWYLAEGCTGEDATGVFETWVLVQNPGDAAADVSLTYMTAAGPVAGPVFLLEPGTRKSVDIAETLPNCWSVSTSVESSAPVVAERSMYLDTPQQYRQAATDSIGVTGGNASWYLAEGCTGVSENGGFETWVLVQNPLSETAGVRLTYMTAEGAVAGPSMTLAPMSRQSVNIADVLPGCWNVSTQVDSDRPVIAERAMYWSAPGCARQAATDSIGASSPATTWSLAEGSTGAGKQGSFETWVLVQNPGSYAATVRLTYMTGGGPVSGPTLSVPANSRTTVDVSQTVPGAWDVSTQVTANAPVIVERAMYWNAPGVPRQAATDSVGASGQAPSTPSSTSQGGRRDYAKIQKPSRAGV
jgi:hypothetical protein